MKILNLFLINTVLLIKIYTNISINCMRLKFLSPLYRLRELANHLQHGEVPISVLQKALQYAACVLDTVCVDDSRYEIKFYLYKFILVHGNVFIKLQKRLVLLLRHIFEQIVFSNSNYTTHVKRILLHL